MTTQQTTATNFTADGLPTLIGSLPVTSHDEALELIFANTPAIPLWPQLPSIHYEGMLNQFIEGFPGIIEEDGKTYFKIDTGEFEQEHLKFFEEYLASVEAPENLDKTRFRVSGERAAGIYLLADKAKKINDLRAIKGQITGPFTLLTGLKDHQKRAAFYDPTIREMAVKGLAQKAAWQVQMLSQCNVPVIVFIDEPALAGLGSSEFISINKEDIGQDITEVIDAIHQSGGLAGVHVCANTDWNLLFAIDLNIISFDAYSFFDRFITSKDQVHRYLDRGGIIAWGIVPTSEEEHITGETSDSLAAKWEEQAAQLETGNRDKKALLKQTLITPSCGTGSLTRALAVKVLELTRDVSRTLREKYL